MTTRELADEIARFVGEWRVGGASNGGNPFVVEQIERMLAASKPPAPAQGENAPTSKACEHART